MTETRRHEEKLDETVEDSFPASDPPSHTPSIGPTSTSGAAKATDSNSSGCAGRDGGTAGSNTPAASPSDDRHAAETAAGRVDVAPTPEKHNPEPAIRP
jgi:hypothetical protein